MHASYKELKCLIADDDATTCRVLLLMLRELGHQVVGEAHDGEKAVELCEKHKPDIVFMDIDMPRMNGLQAVEKIRSGNPAVGVIMISGLPTLGNVQTAMQAGASGFVVKPFKAAKVQQAIAQCLKQMRQTKEQGNHEEKQLRNRQSA